MAGNSKLSEARRKANKKWDDNNKERKRYINARSAAKGFITKRATREDLIKLNKLITELLDK